jgi:hypothetical protein
MWVPQIGSPHAVPQEGFPNVCPQRGVPQRGSTDGGPL